MSGKLRDQSHRAVHALDNKPVDPAQIVAEQPKQRIERWARLLLGLAIGTRHRGHRVLLRLGSANHGWRTSLTRRKPSEHRMVRRVKGRTGPERRRPAGE